MARSQKIILIIFLIIGTIIQVIPLFKSGHQSQIGIGFWGANGHDAVWHLSLINNISNPLKIDMPIFAGETLKNYHPFYDILISFLVKISGISASVWYFKIFPIISSFLFLWLSFVLGKMFTAGFRGGILFLSLNALANSFGWIYTLLTRGNFDGESIFWAMQSPSNQINPPYTLSLIFLLVLLIIVYRNFSNKNLTLFQSLFVFFLLILLPITKAYSAVIGFSVFGLYALHSKSLKNIILTIFSLFVALILFFNYNPQSSGLMIFRPFWFINSMIESPDRIFIPYLANMRYTLEASGKIGPRYLILMLSTFFLFIIGNFGWRLLGFLKTNFRDKFSLILLINIFVLTLIPTFFIQKGTSWNTIQFLYYALFLSNLFLASYLQKHKGLTFIIFATYFLSLLGSWPNYLGRVPPAVLTTGELSALDYLSQQAKGTVLTVPYDQYLKQSLSEPVPLYAYETTAYVSAYSRLPVFLEDEMNNQNSGYDVASRRQQSESFFSQKNIYEDRGFLVNNQIDYIYLAGVQKERYLLDVSNLYLSKIFENEDSLIYRVQR